MNDADPLPHTDEAERLFCFGVAVGEAGATLTGEQLFTATGGTPALVEAYYTGVSVGRINKNTATK